MESSIFVCVHILGKEAGFINPVFLNTLGLNQELFSSLTVARLLHAALYLKALSRLFLLSMLPLAVSLLSAAAFFASLVLLLYHSHTRSCKCNQSVAPAFVIRPLVNPWDCMAQPLAKLA